MQDANEEEEEEEEGIVQDDDKMTNDERMRINTLKNILMTRKLPLQNPHKNQRSSPTPIHAYYCGVSL